MAKPPIFLRYPSLGVLSRKRKKLLATDGPPNIVRLSMLIVDWEGFKIECSLSLPDFMPAEDPEFVWHAGCAKAYRFLAEAMDSPARQREALNDAYTEYVPGKEIVPEPRRRPVIKTLRILLAGPDGTPAFLREGVPEPYKPQSPIPGVILNAR